MLILMAGNRSLISGEVVIDREAIAQYLNENCFDFILTVSPYHSFLLYLI